MKTQKTLIFLLALLVFLSFCKANEDKEKEKDNNIEKPGLFSRFKGFFSSVFRRNSNSKEEKPTEEEHNAKKEGHNAEKGEHNAKKDKKNAKKGKKIHEINEATHPAINPNSG
ncbi:uncharacterized protein NESG_01026 [Nematocida ausubeli]|uniref:Uncharacterized protein n=1 Tax=Nematocida ausubeli (strain ATCC PRA-371 / ERTm2) TaxID=1913371 RepID=A0A086J402_NEMA1|nr:uncharacterized protein NESG_01026 [Nematocida ausubeli]KFG26870.1 hypothetical protein NESG_01026 [Nematocida ausubeli]